MKPPATIPALHDSAIALDAPLHAAVSRAARSRLADFLDLTKPRMNFLVIITTAVGYYMAVRYAFEWVKLLHTLLGTLLTASAAGVLNQYIERRYDARMRRTAGRPLPAGRLSPADALIFGLILALLGIAYLALSVNLLTALLGAFTLLTYVFIYTPLKRYTSLNTIIGAIPGAIPPVMGWTAVHGAIAPEALALFAILFFWQMPHFLAIAILYRDDYAAAGFKMLPVVDPGLRLTGRQIILYSLWLIPITLVPVLLHMAGGLYFVMALLLGLAFLHFAVSCAATRTRADARKLFLASILYLPLLLAMLMIDKIQV
jgi:protoheme IX farnesyltransferase